MSDDNEAEPKKKVDDLCITRVVVEVLHRGPLEWDSLQELHEMGTFGDVSLYYSLGDTMPLQEREFIARCEVHGTDPGFFGLDNVGDNPADG